MMCLCVGLFGFILIGTLCFPHMCDFFFTSLGRFSPIISSNRISIPCSLSFPSGNSMMYILLCLMLPQRSLRHSSFLKLSFLFHCLLGCLVLSYLLNCWFSSLHHLICCWVFLVYFLISGIVFFKKVFTGYFLYFPWHFYCLLYFCLNTHWDHPFFFYGPWAFYNHCFKLSIWYFGCFHFI